MSAFLVEWLHAWALPLPVVPIAEHSEVQERIELIGIMYITALMKECGWYRVAGRPQTGFTFL